MPVQEGLRLGEMLLEQVRGTRSRLEAQSLLSSGVLYAMGGEFDQARAFVNEALSINLELGNRVTWGAQSAEAAKVELLAGDPPAAERVARAAYESLAQLGEKGYLSGLAPRLARAIYLQGRYKEAEHFTQASEAAAASDDVASQSEWRAVLALIRASTGQLDAAEKLAREAVQMIERTDYLDQHADALVGLAEILHLSDQTEPAKLTAHKALQLYERKGSTVSAGRVRALLEQRNTIST